MNKNDALDILKGCRSELEERFGVVKIGIFGSAVRGEATEASDVDVAVELDEAHKTMKNFLDLKRCLEEYFNREVDLGIESALKPRVKKLVEKEIIYIH